MYKSTSEGRMGIYAKVVEDSMSPTGLRLSTLEIQAPKFLDAEFEKHRMLSSNSSSSRAIPFMKAIEEPGFYPFDVRRNEKGMQGYTSLKSEDRENFNTDLHYLRDEVIDVLIHWEDVVHKQHLNRYLDPWVLQKKVVTATEWDNFFTLRLGKDAQPEMQSLARCMSDAMHHSDPDPNEIHTPYLTADEREILGESEKMMCSVARCARVSYKNHDNSDANLEDDIRLHDFLLQKNHMSPFEHTAKPEVYNPKCHPVYWDKGITHIDRQGRSWSGNFRGWIQYRHCL